MLSLLMPWLGRKNVVTAIGKGNDKQCPGGCSSPTECKPFFDCFLNYVTVGNVVPPPQGMRSCVSTIAYPFQCTFAPYSIESSSPTWSSPEYDISAQQRPCAFEESDPNEYPVLWDINRVDANLMIFREGGTDSMNVFWPSPKPNQNFLQQFGTNMLDEPSLSCSLEKPCDDDIPCERVGSRNTLGLGLTPPQVFKSSWGFFVTKSLTNINRQLHNQYNAIQGGGTLAALKVPNIEEFFPEPKKPPGFLKALQGIGTFFGAVAGFVPGFEAIGGAAGAILPAIGSAIEGGISGAEDLEEKAEETFADSVEAIYQLLIQALGETTNKLFRGEKLGTENPMDIGDMIAGGKWVHYTSITPIPDAERQMKLEIISRGINALWGTYSSNKRWVMYVDLLDPPGSIENCKVDTTGPPDSKYCADGGVYYTYNFIEDGDHKGHVDYPWGGDKLYKIDPNMDLSWVTEASAKTYQLAKNATLQLDPFNFSTSAGSAASVAALIQQTQPAPGSAPDIGGRTVGSWTLPVCNASTWGKRWNWDYTKGKDGGSHPPCMCGEGGKETAAWAHAAGMDNFDTFRMRCWSELTQHHDFQWPDGVDEVDLGFGGAKFKRPDPNKLLGLGW